MNAADDDQRRHPPGTRRPARFRPRFHYELIGCGVHGHELVGTDAAQVRPQDELLVREPGDGLRWYRCVRCDAWVPLPDRDHIELPLRGRPLRDRYVLRLIALDRVVHFLVLGVLAAAVVLFAANREALSQTFYRVLDAVQGGVGGPTGQGGGGILGELQKAFAAKPSTLWIVGVIIAGYALLEGLEAVGLWRGKRWAEYLTFIATTLLLIPEVYELTGTITATKIVTLIINLAVVAYLLFAKRLFGLRGGGLAEAAERARDSGWDALERSLPAPTTSSHTPASGPPEIPVAPGSR
jgi:uncharacterized membrane protein (DUF2068 family)